MPITHHHAINALRAVVAEAGDNYVYEPPNPVHECVYQYEGRPSCGVGRALDYIGVPDGVLYELDRLGTKAPTVGQELPGSLPINHDRVTSLLPITEEALEVLSAFQFAQDDRSPWREALDVAEGAYSTITRF